MWQGLRIATAMLAVASVARAQSTDLDTYALFAAEALRARGLRVPAGDVGVNAGPLWVTDALNGPDATVVADLVRVGRKARCAGILADAVAEPASGCPAVGPFAGPLVPDVADACDFPSKPSACDPTNDVEVGHDETRTLPPGVYGDLRVAGGGAGKGRVVFTGGDYVFCEIRTSRKSVIEFAAPTTIVVEEDVTLGTASTTGPASGEPADVELFVGGGSVRVARRAEVTARLCAPAARLSLSSGSDVTGSFVAKLIRADRVTATNAGSVEPTTTTSVSTTTTITTTTSTSPSTSTSSSTTTSTTAVSTTTTTTTTVPACDPARGIRATVTIAYDREASDLNSMVLDLVYPGSVGIPGSGQEPSVQQRIAILDPTPSNYIFLGNDRDLAPPAGVEETLTVAVSSLADTLENPADGVPVGPIVAVQFDCAGGPPPDSSAFGCFVQSASTLVGTSVAVACSVEVEPGSPTTTSTTEPPTTTTVAPTTTSTIVTTTSSTVATTSSTRPSTTTTTTSSSSTSTTTSSSSTSTTSLPPTTTSSSSTTTTSTSSTTTTTIGGPAVCGNGIVEGTEECDDMNDDNNDDCVAGCKDATCGDGFFWSGVEQCDDKNTANGDGCSSTCVIEPPVCGNGRIEAGETCDDSNTLDGDACPSNCRIEFCSPSALKQDTTVVFTKPAGVNVGSIVVFVNYPDAKVGLPGTGNASTVRSRITTLPTGFVHTANDLDYAIREVLSPSLPGNVLNGSTLFKASFDRCSGASLPAAGEYTCTVEQVGSPTGTSLDPAQFSCSITIP
jgi:cysteine-rich repeat protein